MEKGFCCYLQYNRHYMRLYQQEAGNRKNRRRKLAASQLPVFLVFAVRFVGDRTFD